MKSLMKLFWLDTQNANATPKYYGVHLGFGSKVVRGVYVFSEGGMVNILEISYKKKIEENKN